MKPVRVGIEVCNGKSAVRAAGVFKYGPQVVKRLRFDLREEKHKSATMIIIAISLLLPRETSLARERGHQGWRSTLVGTHLAVTPLPLDNHCCHEHQELLEELLRTFVN